ncbi:MAG: adenylate kinase [Nitrospirales bacterium]
MRAVFLGAPGVGKGTQAERVADTFGVCRISTGDILREAVRNHTPLGKQAKSCMDKGDLVPDAVVIGIVRDKLAEPVCAAGYLLDGFPRTVPQAEELSKVLEERREQLDRVVNVVVPREAIVQRLTGRRSCPTCQAVYHVDFAPPTSPGVCDRCGGPLVQRSDDRRETVEARLSVYEQQTAPLIQYYRERGLLSDLDGTGSIEDVNRRLVTLLSAHGHA